MKKKSENYLDRKPSRSQHLVWSIDDKGVVTLEIENTGIFNRIAQKCFHKPKITYVHLDAMGSFLWPLLDGEKTIADLGNDVDAKFGEEAYPLYERLAKYMQILDSYGFITWN